MRSLRWEPIAGLAALVTLAVVAATAGSGAALHDVVGAGLVLCAASLAFTADDVDLAVLPTIPRSPGRRLVRRLAWGLPLVAGTWLVVGALAARSDTAGPPASAGAAIAALALAIGVVTDRWSSVPSPGAVGAAALVLGVAVVTLLTPPPHLVASLTSATSCALAFLVSGIAVAVSVRDQR